MYLLYLIIDLGLLYLTARELLLLLRLPGDFDLVEKGLSCALMACSLIILSSLLVGYVEIYSSLTITFIFLIVLGIVRGWRLFRGHGNEAATKDNNHFRERESFSFDSKLGLGFVLIVVFVLVLSAAFAFPLNFDSQSYRLSRIGYWLQENSIHHFPTPDDRQNYSGFNGDLLMMWLIGHFPSGYYLSNAVQALAGIMMLASLWIFSKLLGFCRLARIAVLVSMFTVPVFVAQFTTSQNDLLVASFMFAGLTFFTSGVKTRSLKRMLFAWVGISIACGTKGTVFYWGPGLVCFAITLFIIYRSHLKWLIQAGAIGVACLALLGAPRYVENWLHWGNPFSSPEHYEMMHGERQFSVEKFTLNAASLGIQNLAPISNTIFLETPLRSLSSVLSDAVPEDESSDNLIAGDRNVFLERVVNYQGKRAASDFSSIGLPLSLAILAGAFVCLCRRKDEDSSQGPVLLCVLSLSAISYFLIFASLFKYQPYTSRYFLMLAPVGAICIGFFINSWSQRPCRVAYYLILFLAISVSAETYFKGSNSGFQNLFDSSNYRTRMVFNAQKNVIKAELDEAEQLAYNFGRDRSICAGLFRNSNGVTARYVSLEHLKEYPSVNDFLKAEGFDSLILDSGIDAESGGAFCRVYAHEGKFESKQSFVFYRKSNNAEGNDYITDFSYQTNSEVELYAWTLGGPINDAPHLVLKNHEPHEVDVRVSCGEFKARQLVPPGTECRIPLDVTSRLPVLSWVLGRGHLYDIELVGPEPLVSPFVN